MKAISAILFALAVIFTVILGPQTRPWTWGPSLICLSFALVAAVPAILRQKKSTDTALIVLGVIIATWFAWRAWLSPVAELKTADLLLLAAAVGSFIVSRATASSRAAEQILVWTLALLVAATCWIIQKQVANPSFNPIFLARPAQLPSGFFGHYNECANFLLGASFLIGGAALFGRQTGWVRCLWGLVAITGLIAIYFTRSRGGILAAGCGVIVFGVVTLLIAKRRRAEWFKYAVLALPVLAAAGVFFVYRGWADAQQLRFKQEIGDVMDGNVRLYLLGIAMSTIGLHPWAGGGSRSFSWECYPFWDFHDNGSGGLRPEQVHNEFVQAATDYGLPAAFLILTLLAWIGIRVLISAVSGQKQDRLKLEDALHLGGIAGLAAMLVQSSFSFVFHLLPGAILLGICLGRSSVKSELKSAENQPGGLTAKALLLAATAACCAFALPLGWSGSKVMLALKETLIGPPPANIDQNRLSSLDQAIRIWPQASLLKERAQIYQKIAGSNLPASETSTNLQKAISDYQAAIRLHPFDAVSTINLAEIYSFLGKYEEADPQYEASTRLQGGMEDGIYARTKFNAHLLKKGNAQMRAQQYSEALQSFDYGLSQYESMGKLLPWMPQRPAVYTVQCSLLLGKGAALEALGDQEAALQTYATAETLFKNAAAFYRSSILLGNLATDAWSERRQSEALTLYQQALAKLNQVSALPHGVTQEQRDKYLAYLTETIQFLIEAKVQPNQIPGQ